MPERCRVVVKARPTPLSEADTLGDGIALQGNHTLCVNKPAASAEQPRSEPRLFGVDRVYLADDNTLFDDEVAPLVDSVRCGYRATVFAYGASGSGKTHTVCGGRGAGGLVDRAVDRLFDGLDPETCSISVSAEELYMEKFTCLLGTPVQRAPAAPPAARAAAALGSSSSCAAAHAGRRTLSDGTTGWRPVAADSAEQAKRLLGAALRKRHTASTCINDRSSRSHVIVTLSVVRRVPAVSSPPAPAPAAADDDEQGGSSSSSQQHSRSSEAGSEPCSSPREASSVPPEQQHDTVAAAAAWTLLSGQLNIVDLAGSEDVKRSRAEGAAQQEAGAINRSLCHLKTVIKGIYSGTRIATYRNAMLTLRLKDALGGNSRLLVVACISTAARDLAATRETLRYAEMARSIRNTPVINMEPKDVLIGRLQAEVEELRAQLAAREGSGGAGEAAAHLLEQLAAVEAANAELAEALQSSQSNAAELAAALQSSQSNAAELAAAQQAALLAQRSAAQRTASELQGAAAAAAAAGELCRLLLQQLGSARGAQVAAEAACVAQADAAKAAAAAQRDALAQLQQRLHAQEDACHCAQDHAASLAGQLTDATAATDALRQQLHDTVAAASRERAAAALAAAEQADQHAREREHWQAMLDDALRQRDALDQQAAQDRTAHAAALAAARAAHQRELEDRLRSSAARVTQDKARAKAHLGERMKDLLAETRSLADALAAPPTSSAGQSAAEVATQQQQQQQEAIKGGVEGGAAGTLLEQQQQQDEQQQDEQQLEHDSGDGESIDEKEGAAEGAEDAAAAAQPGATGSCNEDTASLVTAAAAAAAASGPGGCWPVAYAEQLPDEALARAAFVALGGVELSADALCSWLGRRALHGQPHNARLPCGAHKELHHLAQDMLAWYHWHMSAAARSCSSASGAGAAEQLLLASSPAPAVTIGQGLGATVDQGLGVTVVDLTAGSPMTAAPDLDVSAGKQRTSCCETSEQQQVQQQQQRRRGSSSSSSSSSLLERLLTPSRRRTRASVAAAAAAAAATPPKAAAAMQPQHHGDQGDAHATCDVATEGAEPAGMHRKAALSEFLRTELADGSSPTVSAALLARAGSGGLAGGAAAAAAGGGSSGAARARLCRAGRGRR